MDAAGVRDFCANEDAWRKDERPHLPNGAQLQFSRSQRRHRLAKCQVLNAERLNPDCLTLISSKLHVHHLALMGEIKAPIGLVSIPQAKDRPCVAFIPALFRPQDLQVSI